jgi:hypothetical protein
MAAVEATVLVNCYTALRYAPAVLAVAFANAKQEQALHISTIEPGLLQMN